MAGVTASLMLGSAAMSAAGSISKGIAEQKQAEANARIYEAQARNIAEAQKITAEQYRTKGNVLRGQAVTTAARNGVKISGTTANSISQSIMQLQMDNSYEQYNLEVKKQAAYDNAALQRYQGKQAFRQGLLNAGKTALTAGVDYHDKYWKGFKAKTGTLLSGGVDTSNNAVLNGQPFTIA